MKATLEIPELNCALALARSENQFHILKGYLLFQSCSSNDSFKHVFIKSLAPYRPDLAMNIWMSLVLKNDPLALTSWGVICASFRRREIIYGTNDLTILLKEILKLFPEHSDAPKPIASKELLEPLNWLCKELMKLGEIDSVIDLLQIAKQEHFEPKAEHELCGFWLNWCENISKDSKGISYLPGIWKKFKALNFSVSTEALPAYQKNLVRVAEEIKDEKTILFDLFKEKFPLELHEKVKSTIISHLEKIVKQIIDDNNIDEASVILNTIVESELNFSKEIGKHVLILFKFVIKNKEKGLPQAAKLLFNPKFESLFIKKDMFFIRFIYFNAAQIDNSNVYSNEIKTCFKLNLDYIESVKDQQKCFLNCAKNLIKFLKVYSLSELPLIKRGINVSKRKFFQTLYNEQLFAEIEEFTTLMSLQNSNNRLEWVAQSIPEMTKCLSSSVVNSIIFSLANQILKSNPAIQEFLTLLALYLNTVKPSTDIWADIMEAITIQKNQELQHKAFDFLICDLEINDLFIFQSQTESAMLVKLFARLRAIP